jgi:hypothetical protein
MSQQSSSTQPLSAKQEQILNYLKEYHVNEELNIIINRLCHSQTDDPFAFLVTEKRKYTQWKSLVFPSAFFSPSSSHSFSFVVFSSFFL